MLLGALLLTEGCDPGAPPPTLGAVEGGPSVLVPAAEGQRAYGGIPRVQVTGSCSGVLLKPTDLSVAAPAYVLTNGHCARAFGSDEVLLDQPGFGSVTFNHFHDASERPSFTVKRLQFSTMKGTDLAILELDTPYADLAQRGIQGIDLERGRPDDDEPVLVVGAPLQDDPSQSFLRLASCRLDGAVGLLLERHWHWFDFRRHRCSDVLPGSSGSPVLSRRNGRLLGLVNTTTIGSQGVTDCWQGRPCEVEAAGGRSVEGASYAAPVEGLASCFDAGGVLDVGLSGCPLDDGRQVEANPAWLGHRNPARAPAGGGGARWDVTVRGTTFPFFRYKVGPAGSVACREPRGYGEPRRVDATDGIDDPLPAAEGHYAACILGENGALADGRGQQPRHATMVTLVVDRTPPRSSPHFQVLDSASVWTLIPLYAPPEITAYLFKFGSLADTACAETAGYRPLLVSPFSIPRTGAAVRLCAIGMDLADNPTPPFEMVLQ